MTSTARAERILRMSWCGGLVAAAACAVFLSIATLSAEETLPALRITRNTPLDRPTVSFLKRVIQAQKSVREYLVVLGPDGRVLATSEGTESTVGVPSIDRSDVAEDEGVVLVHSHPSSTSLSRADLLHLSRPGVEAVVAVGVDGSVYLAARGPRFVPNRMGEFYDTASHAVDEVWRSSGNWQGGPNVKLDPHRAHVVAQGLAASGVIVYRTSLPFDRERSYFDGTILFALMIEDAASEVKDSLR